MIVTFSSFEFSSITAGAESGNIFAIDVYLATKINFEKSLVMPNKWLRLLLQTFVAGDRSLLFKVQ